MTIGERLREERERLAMSQTALGSVGGVLKGAQLGYESGRRSPDAAYLAAVGAAGVDVLYVVMGTRTNTSAAQSAAAQEPAAKWPAGHPVRPSIVQTGAPMPGGVPVQVERYLLAPKDSSVDHPLVLPVRLEEGTRTREYQVVPRYTVRALAGKPTTRETGEQLVVELAGNIAFERVWMQEELGRAGGGFASVTVGGNSMEPTLSEGDSVIIDTWVDRVDADGIYVFRMGVDMFIKRVQRLIDGTLVIKSDNSAYETQKLGPEQLGDIKVMGRVIWPRVR